MEEKERIIKELDEQVDVATAQFAIEVNLLQTIIYLTPAPVAPVRGLCGFEAHAVSSHRNISPCPRLAHLH